VIDIYTHLLPKESGGKQQFLNIAKHLVSQGVQAITTVSENHSEESLAPYIKEANQLLKECNIPLVIGEGIKRVADRKFAETYNHQEKAGTSLDKYIILTLPANEELSYLEPLLFKIQLNQTVPLISAPECHPYFQDNKNELYNLVKKGAIVQLSSDSIVGKNGKATKRAAMQFIEYNLAHVIASGTSLDNYKQHSLREAYEVIAKEKGAEVAQLLMQNAEAIFNGNGIKTLPPERIKKTKFLGIF